MSNSTEEEDTLPPRKPTWRAAYASAEARTDRLLEPLKASPWTFAILAVSHVAAFVLGLWTAW